MPILILTSENRLSFNEYEKTLCQIWTDENLKIFLQYLKLQMH